MAKEKLGHFMKCKATYILIRLSFEHATGGHSKQLKTCLYVVRDY